MNRDEFKALFNDKAVPLLNRFHQSVTDTLGNPILFWLCVFFELLGVVTVLRWLI